MSITAEKNTMNTPNKNNALKNLDIIREVEESFVKTDVGFIPVIFGNSLNAQSYSREFFDKYHTKSIIVTKEELWTTKHSIYADVEEEQDNILQNIFSIQNRIDEGTKLLLLSTTDAGVEKLINLQEQGLLLNNWYMHYPDLDTFNILTKKGEFARIASELGIPHPLTIEVDLENELPDLTSIILEGPLWVKPSHRPEWQQAHMKNQNKAYRVESLVEAQKILEQAAASDFTGTCVVQEEIPGEDDLLVSIDVFCDKGKAVVVSAGRKLMEQKGKQTIGNALAILSGNVPQQGLDDAVRLLEHMEWNGWANVDGKIDPRSGQVIFFEINPRLGRSHYYITASGYSAITPYVDKMFGTDIAPAELEDDVLFSSVPFDEVFTQLSDPHIIVKTSGIDLDNIHNPLFSTDDNSPERLAVIREAYENKWWLD